jgi:hypothetical protein
MEHPVKRTRTHRQTRSWSAWRIIATSDDGQEEVPVRFRRDSSECGDRFPWPAVGSVPTTTSADNPLLTPHSCVEISAADPLDLMVTRRGYRL